MFIYRYFESIKLFLLFKKKNYFCFKKKELDEQKYETLHFLQDDKIKIC